MNVTDNTPDEKHPEGALDFFCASAKYAFFRITDNYKAGYNNIDETKIIHCFCNSLFASQFNELFFLLKCVSNRGILQYADIMQCLGNAKFPNDMPEYLFWDLDKKGSYKDQIVYTLENKGEFFPT